MPSGGLSKSSLNKLINRFVILIHLVLRSIRSFTIYYGIYFYLYSYSWKWGFFILAQLEWDWDGLHQGVKLFFALMYFRIRCSSSRQLPINNEAAPLGSTRFPYPIFQVPRSTLTTCSTPWNVMSWALQVSSARLNYRAKRFHPAFTRPCEV